jgi:hypothetical protein
MYKKIFALFLIVGLFTIHCKIVDFGERGTNILVHVDRFYQAEETTSSYAKMDVINFQDEYDNAGVNPEDVLKIVLSNVQIIIERNGTGATTEADGEIWFKKEGTSTEYELASFPMTNLNSVLNVPIDPFAVGAANLTLNPTSVQQLKLLLLQSQAPSIIFYFRGDVSSPPIDFDARLIVDLIVEVKVI